MPPIMTSEMTVEVQMPMAAKGEAKIDRTRVRSDSVSAGELFEYVSAANPKLAPIPVLFHKAELHETGK